MEIQCQQREISSINPPSCEKAASDKIHDMKPAGTLDHVFIFTGGFAVLLGFLLFLFYVLMSPSAARANSDVTSIGEGFLKSGIIAVKDNLGGPLPNTIQTSMMMASRSSDDWEQQTGLLSAKAALPLLIGFGLWLKFHQLRLASNASKLGVVTTDNAALTKGRSSTTIQA